MTTAYLLTLSCANRPGIVHRLDRLTSGVIVMGRTLPALQSLKASFLHTPLALLTTPAYRPHG